MIPFVFPTINGAVPYKSPVATIVTELFVINSTNTTNNRGIVGAWFAWETFSDTPDFTDLASQVGDNYTVNKIKWYSGTRWPDEVSSAFDGSKDQFGVKYLPYYKANSTSATFYMWGAGNARMEIAAAGGDTGTRQLSMTAAQINSLHVTGLTPGTNYLVSITYWSNSRSTSFENSLVCTYEDSLIGKPVPLSAGAGPHIVDISSPPAPIPITQVNNIVVDSGKRQATALTFDVPLNPSSVAYGYSYDQAADKFDSNVAADNSFIQKFRKVWLNVGYSIGGATSTVSKFVGQVRGWKPTRTAEGKDVLRVTCYDWSAFLKDDFNRGNPDKSDYLAHHYVFSSQEGNNTNFYSNSMPRTYDAWKLDDAIENILLNANIDPVTYRGKRKAVTVDDETVETSDWLIKDKNSNKPIVLDRNEFLGQAGRDINEEPDDPYIWQFSVGSAYYDNLQSILDNYGVEFGFNNEGKFFTDQFESPSNFIPMSDFTETGSWSNVLAPAAMFAYVRETTTDADTTVYGYEGSNLQFVAIVGPNAGTINVNLTNATLGVLVSQDVSLSHTSTWYFANGVDNSVGFNPAVFNVGTDLKFGTYTLTLTSVGAKPKLINGLVMFDKDYDSPNDVMYTGDLGGNKGVITGGLSASSDASFVRNEAIVVGRSIGKKVTETGSSERNPQTVNPNNPVSSNIVARTLDLTSTGSLSNANFVGRKLTTFITNPQLANIDRAQWLSEQTVFRYNQFGKSYSPAFESNLHPRVQLNDLIRVEDIKLGVLSTIQNYWVTGVRESFTRDKAITTLKLDSWKPWTSFFNPPAASLQLYDNNPIYNIRAFNTGVGPQEFGRVSKVQGAITATIFVEYGHAFFESQRTAEAARFEAAVPWQGYIKMGAEIIEYKTRVITIPTNTNVVRVQYGQLTRGVYNTVSEAINSTKKVEGFISPYSQEDHGIVPLIQFDLLLPGEVKLEVRNHVGVLLYTLTGTDGDVESKRWDKLPAGASNPYSWNMIDNHGEHNSINVGAFASAGDNTLDIVGANPNTLGKWNNFYGGNFRDHNWPTPVTLPRYLHLKRKIDTAGWYAANKMKQTYGEFTVTISYRDLSGQYLKNRRQVPRIVDQKIYTTLRHTGTLVDPRAGTQGVVEEFSPSPLSGFVAATRDATTGLYEAGAAYNVATLWYHYQTRAPFKTKSGWSRNESPAFRAYYTGDDTYRANGETFPNTGLLFAFSNTHPQKRLVRVIGKMIVYTFGVGYLHHHYIQEGRGGAEWTTTTMLKHVSKGVEFPLDIPIQPLFMAGSNDTRPSYLSIPAPAGISFIHGLETHINDFSQRKRASNSSYDYGSGLNTTTTTTPMYYAVCQLHVVQLEVTDMSGRTYHMWTSIFYVPPEFDTTPGNETDGLANGSTNWKVQMHSHVDKVYNNFPGRPVNWDHGHSLVDKVEDGQYFFPGHFYGTIVFKHPDWN